MGFLFFFFKTLYSERPLLCIGGNLFSYFSIQWVPHSIHQNKICTKRQQGGTQVVEKATQPAGIYYILEGQSKMSPENKQWNNINVTSYYPFMSHPHYSPHSLQAHRNFSPQQTKILHVINVADIAYLDMEKMYSFLRRPLRNYVHLDYLFKKIPDARHL